jgi:ADP-dependent phosphofructokinase/glucokinase
MLFDYEESLKLQTVGLRQGDTLSSTSFVARLS